jgi:hypothetical protein
MMSEEIIRERRFVRVHAGGNPQSALYNLQQRITSERERVVPDIYHWEPEPPQYSLIYEQKYYLRRGESPETDRTETCGPNANRLLSRVQTIIGRFLFS